MSLSSFLGEIEGRGIQPGLERIQCALDELELRNLDADVILVGGTNGKGSTAKRIESGYRALGFKTFLYTSPHLVHVEERFRINGVKTSTKDLDDAHTACLAKFPEGRCSAGLLTPFEWMTLVAGLLAKTQACEILVLEVGLGGRFDATNAFEPAVSVITGIDLDHMDRLGDDLASIGREKAGIMRDGIPCVLGATTQPWIDAGNALLEGRDFQLSRGAEPTFTLGDDCLELVGADPHLPVFDSSLALALATLKIHQDPSPSDFERCVRAAAASDWPGRMQRVADTPLLILDGGHNPSAIEWLVSALQRIYVDTRFHVIFGARPGKDHRSMVHGLRPILERLTLVGDREKFLVPPNTLADDLPEIGAFRVYEGPAIDLLKERTEPTLVVGSLYLVGEVLGDLGVDDELRVLA